MASYFFSVSALGVAGWFRLRAILMQDDEGYQPDDAEEIARSLLDFANCEAGLLCHRGLGRYGFFHLTFERNIWRLTIWPAATCWNVLRC